MEAGLRNGRRSKAGIRKWNEKAAMRRRNAWAEGNG